MKADPQRTHAGSPAHNPLPHLIVTLNRQGIAIAADHVREILRAPLVVPVPGAPPHVRGVIDVRGEVLQVIDLRLRLGMPPRTQEIEELVAVLRAREEDHRNWLRELEASVKERRAFTLARDPHKCKFGQWYDSYHPDNVALEFIWAQFDQPHQRIHAIADVVTAHVGRSEFDQALALIDQTRGGALGAMIGLFAEATQAVRQTNRELVIILDHDDRAIAVTVDAADDVGTIPEADMLDLPPLPDRGGTAVISRTARRGSGGDLLLVLDAGKLFPDRPAEADPVALSA